MCASEENKWYVAIDLKSFYASVECIERNLNPLDTYLVVADKSRTNKTICLAVTPALKSYGISSRARLFEVEQSIAQINCLRKRDFYKNLDSTWKNSQPLSNKSTFGTTCTSHSILQRHPELKLDYIIAPPQMAKYVEVSTTIYGVYLQFVAPEDIHVYSIDEVFIDVSPYLRMYKCGPEELANEMIKAVLKKTGITATVGVGTNMYLAKIAMDIIAKKMPPDENGARIAQLTELEYRKQLWEHRPITDFWMIGPGYTRRLSQFGMHTMGDIAQCSIHNEDLLYEIFGINAELLIDHAWGWEPCDIATVKSYKPVSNSLGTGQVLHKPYSFDKARIVIKEMAEVLALDLVDKEYVTNQLVIHVGYDISNLLSRQSIRNSKQQQTPTKILGNNYLKKNRNLQPALGSINGTSPYVGDVITDPYGRKIPKYTRVTINLDEYTSSGKTIMNAVDERFVKAVNPDLLMRRINITANNLLDCDENKEIETQNLQRYTQLDIFTDYSSLREKYHKQIAQKIEENNLQKAVISIKKKYGKNSILRGMNFLDGATMKDRNCQIGGHKA